MTCRRTFQRVTRSLLAALLLAASLLDIALSGAGNGISRQHDQISIALPVNEVERIDNSVPRDDGAPEPLALSVRLAAPQTLQRRCAATPIQLSNAFPAAYPARAFPSTGPPQV